jgi:hypothetical protein
VRACDADFESPGTGAAGTSIGGMRLRVAIWNMQQRADAWAYLDTLDVDVALVQEAVPPRDERPAGWRSVPAHDEPELWQIDSSRQWSSAIASNGHPLTEVAIVRP